MDKLSIHNEMAQLDLKNRNFYRDLTDEERKKFSIYLMIRWGSCVSPTINEHDRHSGLESASVDMQHYYLVSCNERLNKNFFAVNRDPQLQWLSATTVSPGMGRHKHQWLAPKKKDTGNNETKKILMEIMPTAKMSDIDVLSQLISKKELKEYLKQHGEE